MTITVKLPKQLEEELSDDAARLGFSLTEYVLKILSEARISTRAIKTGADLVAYWEKEQLIGSRSDIKDSQKHARKIRKQVEKRSRK